MNDQQRQYAYDAAGRMRSFDTSNLYQHDGDGQMVRTDRADEWPVYFLRSTVLGGAVVSEIRPMGTNNRNDRKDLIYAAGGVLAIHTIFAATGGGDSQQVIWEYRDAESLSLRSPSFTELDPVGGELGLENHYGEGGGLYVPPTDETEPGYPAMGNPIRPYSGCTLDGMPVSCSELRNRMEAGAVANETLIHNGSRWERHTLPIISDGLGLFHTDRLRVQKGEVVAERFDFAFKTEGPQKPPVRQPMSEEECNRTLEAIFGAPGAVVSTINEPREVHPAYRGNRRHHLIDRGTIHIYADERGSSRQLGLYAPQGGTLIGGGEYPERAGGIIQLWSNQFNFRYEDGLVIQFFHVRGTTGGIAGGETLHQDRTDTNGRGSFRIGYIGGNGGNTTEGYHHTHIQINIGGTTPEYRVDARTIWKLFCMK